MLRQKKFGNIPMRFVGNFGYFSQIPFMSFSITMTFLGIPPFLYKPMCGWNISYARFHGLNYSKIAMFINFPPKNAFPHQKLARAWPFSQCRSPDLQADQSNREASSCGCALRAASLVHNVAAFFLPSLYGTSWFIFNFSMSVKPPWWRSNRRCGSHRNRPCAGLMAMPEARRGWWHWALGTPDVFKGW